MIITNNHNIDDIFVRQIKNHIHRGGWLTASQATDSPRIFWLKKRHEHEATQDVTECLYMIRGTMFHLLAEKNALKNEFAEEYLEDVIAGRTVTGTSDLYRDNSILIDYKTTSSWAAVYELRYKDWEVQLNIYAYLWRRVGFIVEKLKVKMWFYDWNKFKVGDGNYPELPVKEIELPLWTEEEQYSFLFEKITHLNKFENVPDNKLPPCSDQDRWCDPAKWKVYKKGNKRALAGGTFEDRQLAQEFAENKSAEGLNVIIEHFPAKSKRCKDYCPYRQFCNQYQEENNVTETL